MMKKVITIIATAFIAISASAQSELGSLTWQPNAGVTYTTATSELGEWADGAVSITTGVEAMYMLKDKLGGALGVNYTGLVVKDTVRKRNLSNYYLNLPVMANYYVAPTLSLKAGVALNILLDANMSPTYGNPYYYDSYYSNVEELWYQPKDYYKSVFLSIPVGASYEIKNFVLDAHYNIGVSKVADVCKGTFNSYSFTVGYKF